MTKKKILILCDYYSPGYKAGGPIQSIRNVSTLLNEHSSISIITRDTDLGDKTPYSGIASDQWIFDEELGVEIFYCSAKLQNRKSILDLVCNKKHDLIYLNSFFSPVFSVSIYYGLLTNRIGSKVIVAPRGELNEGALNIKSSRKKIFRLFFSLFGLHKMIRWQATTQFEKTRIESVYGNRTDIRIAENVPKQLQRPWLDNVKESGSAKFVMVSRVSQIKNINFFLKLLFEINGDVQIDIIGPKEDLKYFEECVSTISNLPENVVVNFLGAIPNQEIEGKMVDSHFFVSPTKGENFGHSIFDAMLAGLPIVISDKTPWRDLSKTGVGWDLSLDTAKHWLEIVNICIDMDNHLYKKLSKNAWKYASTIRSNPIYLTQVQHLFRFE